MDDELGSFFAEIEEIATAVEETSSVAPVSNIVTEVIASKPAEIREQKSHPVYTYDQLPYGVVDYSAYEETNAFESAAAHNGVYGKPAPPPLPPPCSSSSSNNQPASLPFIPRQNKQFVRKAADDVWIDDTLQEWPENDFRIFVGDLAKDVTTEMLIKQFQQYKSFAKAKVMRTKGDNKARGFGFVSFLDANDCLRAMKEMNGKYLGVRPMRIKRSTWQDRQLEEVKEKESKKRKFQSSYGLA